MSSHSGPRLDKERHVKYWKRCAGTYLPSQYTATDSTRLMWACFIFSAHDLLSMPITPPQRISIRQWVLSLQHPDGGFCGSSTHAHTGQNARKGESNIAATYFALVLLALAAEGDGSTAFQGVRRRKLLSWLRRLQRQDGSFGQNLWDGETVGGKDTRHSYFASSIRWILRGNVQDGHADWVEDIDVEKMAEHVRLGQTYDGGLAEVSSNESHGKLSAVILSPSQLTTQAGYVYTSVAALAFLDRSSPGTNSIQLSLTDPAGLLKFLAGRQFTYLEEEENDPDEDDAENFVEAQLSSLTLDNGCTHVGYNGRWNKKADTCYCWWVAGSLKVSFGLADGPFTQCSNDCRCWKLNLMSASGPRDSTSSTSRSMLSVASVKSLRRLRTSTTRIWVLQLWRRWEMRTSKTLMLGCAVPWRRL